MREPNNKNGGLATASVVVIIVKFDRGQSFTVVSGDLPCFAQSSWRIKIGYVKQYGRLGILKI